MPKRKQVDLDTAFLYAHGIRVSPSTFKEMVVEAVERMRRIQDQPLPPALNEEIAALSPEGAPPHGF